MDLNVARDLDLDELRVAVYRWFAGRGEAPTVRDLVGVLAAEVDAIEEGLRALHDDHYVVTDDGGAIVMAHPWAASDLGFVVASHEQTWWGGCAWDSLAIPSVLGVEVLVATRCPGCDRPLALSVSPEDGPRGDDLVAHFLVPVARMWDDVVHTCAHQRLFCSESHVEAWLAAEDHERGAVLDLDTLWRLASRWYEGRMTRSYRRRTPAEAAEFFASIGLEGDFWSVPGVSPEC